MIPESIDPLAVLDQINATGIKDAKIGIWCGFPDSYVWQIRNRRIKRISYERGAKLLNLLESRVSIHNATSGTIAPDVV
jgi:hypothetical protein